VDEVAKTDVPDYALDEFRRNQVKDVHVLIRRGPEQAAFDLKEIRDITEMEGVTVICQRADLPDPIPEGLPRDVAGKLELLSKHAYDKAPTGGKRMFLHFFRSPTEIGGANGQVAQIKVEHTKIVDVDGVQKARGTGEFTTFDVGLVVSAAGYRGAPIPGIPFDQRAGTIPNQTGRVLGEDGKPVPGLYVAGWIKRGPSGVIGTNKACAVETVKSVGEDLATSPPKGDRPGRSAIAGALKEAGVRAVSWEDWLRLDKAEIERGTKVGKVREKFLSAVEAFSVLDT
jgi:ferredoxin--NADP+ reductase